MSHPLARLSGLTVLVALACGLSVRADDVLDQKKKEIQLEAQKLITDANTALETSRTLEKTDAAAAKTLLEKRLREVTDSSSLDDKERNDLRKKLLDRIRDVTGTLAVQKNNDDFKAKQEADKAAREERERQANSKIENDKKSVYDQSKDKIDSSKKVLDAYAEYKAMREKGATDIQLDVMKTASKMTEERFTKDWLKAKDRGKQKLTPEEKDLLTAINSTISLDLKDVTLKEFLTLIDTKTDSKLPIYLDNASIKEAGVDYDSKISFSGKKVKLRTVLKKVFADLGLTWAIKDAAVQVITPDRIKDYVVTRAYPVGDLVTPIDPRMPPLTQKAYAWNQAQMLIATIVQSIEPTTWKGMSERGYGTIMYDEARQTIVVTHTAEMQYMLGGALSR
jgi:hypothetical protein